MALKLLTHNAQPNHDTIEQSKYYACLNRKQPVSC